MASDRNKQSLAKCKFKLKTIYFYVFIYDLLSFIGTVHAIELHITLFIFQNITE